MRENIPTYNKVAILFENVELFSIIGVPSFVYPVLPLILLAISSVLQWKTILKSVKFGSVSVRVLEGNSTETQKVQSKRPVKGVTYRGVSGVKETSVLGEALWNRQHELQGKNDATGEWEHQGGALSRSHLLPETQRSRIVTSGKKYFHHSLCLPCSLLPAFPINQAQT